MAEINYSPPGPVSRAWMADDSFVKILIGPLGSGKTAAACVEIMRRASQQAPGPDGVRRVRVACIRNTFAELKSTTIKSWSQWCPPSFGKLTMAGSPIVHHIQTPDLDLEVLFMPLNDESDVRKLLSLELTMAWIDEAREIPKDVLDALTGRVGRYPSKLQGGCTWSGIFLTSNPSDTESWLYKVVTNPPEGWSVYRQPGGDTREAENLPNLPQDYYKRIAAGKDDEWKKVFIGGEFGFVIEGKPVYPSFRDSVHVAPARIAPVPGLGLTVGADWGLTPAAVITQQMPDGKILIVDEFVCVDSGIVRFAQTLTAYIRQHYPHNDVTNAVGDPAGTARGPDEKTVFDIVNAHTPWRWRPARTNDTTLRIEAVTAALNRMVDGKPGFIMNPNCGTLRKGFAGGYHFQRVNAGNGTTWHETPRKNQYSHPHDALQYAILSLGGADAVFSRDKAERSKPRMAHNIDYDILGSSDESTPRERRIGVTWGEPNREKIFGRRRNDGAATGADYDLWGD